jgi:hypothetical protein
MIDMPGCLVSDQLYRMFRTWFFEVHVRATGCMEPGPQAETCRAQWAAWRKYVLKITERDFKCGTGCYDTIIKTNIHYARRLVASSKDFMYYYIKNDRSFMIEGLENYTTNFENDVEEMLRMYSVNGRPAIDIFSVNFTSGG